MSIKKDKYKEKFINAITELDKPSIPIEEYEEKLGNIIDKIYEDGFQDGVDEG